MVAQPPDKVRLRFNEPVTPAVVRLIDADGKARDDAVVEPVGETVEIGDALFFEGVEQVGKLPSLAHEIADNVEGLVDVHDLYS